MHIDVEELRDFYNTRLGVLVRRRLASHIAMLWRDRKISCLMGLGFANPYLAAARHPHRVGALMPADQGAMIWPGHGATRSVMVCEDGLPLPDNSVDQLLLTHCLEVSDRPRAMLREIWRVLTPEGRVLMIVPNRRGVWCRLDHTPFGHGSPFSRNQLERLLTDAMLTPEHWSNALYFPPMRFNLLERVAPVIERVSSPLGATLAGVLLVEARKQIAGPVPTAKATTRVRELVTVRRDSN